VLTEAVMRIAPVERLIASSAYSFVRFAGGAVAPWLAGKLAEWVAPDTPFFVGAAAVAVAFVVLIVGRRSFLEEPEVEVEVEHAPVLTAPVLVAVDGSARGATVTAAAAKLATERGTAVEVLHVHRTEVFDEEAVDRGSREMALAVLALRLEQLREAGVPAGGEVVHTFGNRDDAAKAVLDRVDEVGAQLVVVGRKGRVSARATVPVVVVPA
jgi:hypothetical protein